MTESPYKDKDKSEWLEITNQLVEEYPLSKEEILDISIICWNKLWTTKVAGIIDLNDVELPATVVGYFFQKLFAHELQSRFNGEWSGEQEKAHKDLVYISNEKYSTEMKSSGQLGYKVFGNRSYCQKSDIPSKAKAGYYITINFFDKTLNLVSIGWIDKEDWKCQKAESGQAATLSKDTYTYKLIPLYGKYQLKSPISLLKGVGEKVLPILIAKSIYTFKDILDYEGDDKNINGIKKRNCDLLKILKDFL